jgi:chromosome segregation ATPase
MIGELEEGHNKMESQLLDSAAREAVAAEKLTHAQERIQQLEHDILGLKQRIEEMNEDAQRLEAAIQTYTSNELEHKRSQNDSTERERALQQQLESLKSTVMVIPLNTTPSYDMRYPSWY